MPAYLSIDLSPEDHDAIRAYEAQMPPILQKFNAKVIARDEDALTPEGDRDPHIAVIIRFDDKDAFTRFYESREYAPLREFRWANARTSAIVIDGIEE